MPVLDSFFLSSVSYRLVFAFSCSLKLIFAVFLFGFEKWSYVIGKKKVSSFKDKFIFLEYDFFGFLEFNTSLPPLHAPC